MQGCDIPVIVFCLNVFVNLAQADSLFSSIACEQIEMVYKL